MLLESQWEFCASEIHKTSTISIELPEHPPTVTSEGISEVCLLAKIITFRMVYKAWICRTIPTLLKNRPTMSRKELKMKALRKTPKRNKSNLTTTTQLFSDNITLATLNTLQGVTDCIGLYKNYISLHCKPAIALVSLVWNIVQQLFVSNFGHFDYWFNFKYRLIEEFHEQYSTLHCSKISWNVIFIVLIWKTGLFVRNYPTC